MHRMHTWMRSQNETLLNVFLSELKYFLWSLLYNKENFRCLNDEKVVIEKNYDKENIKLRRKK